MGKWSIKILSLFLIEFSVNWQTYYTFKATAGGGGRGMRLAKEPDEFVKMLQVLPQMHVFPVMLLGRMTAILNTVWCLNFYKI